MKTLTEIKEEVQAKANGLDCGQKINPLGLKGIEVEAQERFRQVKDHEGVLGISVAVSIQDYAGIRWDEEGNMSIVKHDITDDSVFAFGPATEDNVLFLLKAVKKLSKELYSVRHRLDVRDALESGLPIPKFGEDKD